MLRRWIRHRKKRSSNLFAGIVLVSITASNLLGILLFQTTTNSIPSASSKKSALIADRNSDVILSTVTEPPSSTPGTKGASDPLTISPNALDNTKFYFSTTGGVSDSQHRYKAQSFVVSGDGWQNISSKYSVCLATQTSLDRLHFLLEVAGSWTGPISVAVFVPGLDAKLVEAYIVFLRMCSANIRKHASFHFAYPNSVVLEKTFDRSYLKGFQCNAPKSVLQSLLEFKSSWFGMYTPKQVLYPQNFLRNVARRGCATEYHFLTDIDIVPKPELADDLNAFFRTTATKPCATKCVYVIPTYETLETERIPRTKTDLLRLVKNRKAQPFHFTVFIHNQYASNHSVWEKLPDRTKIEAAYKVTNYEFFYEPFYVGDGGVPWHDERFIGYGFTRNTQVFETYLSGYEFWVLNPAFAVHRGIQSRRARSQWREKQNIRNRKIFVHFKQEVLEKYKKNKNPAAAAAPK